MSATEAPVSSPSTDLERTVDLSAPVVFDSVNERRLDLIRRTVAQKATDLEIAQFLELAQAYDLDPFAKEVWCVVSESNGNRRLLIMVGRDGLRKIAQRNGLHVDGDVVCKNDEIAIVRTPDGNRTVAHSYGNPTTRGEIVGAWAEVRQAGPTGKPMGYFYAPLDEYMPANVSKYSPWSKQVGVMILAAAERQAIRQATPLGGLMAEGEDESAQADATGYGLAAPSEHGAGTLPPELAELVRRAHAIDPQEWRPIEIAARLPEPGDRDYDRAVEDLTTALTTWLAENEPTDAVVVDEHPQTDEPRAVPIAEEETPPAAAVSDVDSVEALNARWREDAQWRKQVGDLVGQFADLESALDDAVASADPGAVQLRADLQGVEDAMGVLGVPAGWMPPADAS